MNKTEDSPMNPSTTMSMSFEEITPDAASGLLAAVPDHQRSLSLRRVAAMACDMRRGEWIPTHQPIGINVNNETDDGQHRAAAGVDAGCSFQSWVCRGVPISAYRYIDAGKSRSVNEATDVTREQAAIVRQFLRVSDPNKIATFSEIVEMRDDYRHAIDWVIGQTSGRIGNQRKPTGVIRAAMVRASFTMNTGLFARMIHLLYEGSIPHAEPGDASILRLREYILAGFKVRSVRTPEFRDVIYAKTESAICSYIDGVDLRVLRPVLSEQFDLPDNAEAAAP